MEFTCEHHFNATVDQVLAMYRDPDYLSSKYRELGLRDIEIVSRTADDQHFQVVCRFKRKSSIEVPKMAQKFIGSSDWVPAQQTDRWDIASRSGRLDVVIEPLKSITSIRCEMKLETTAAGAVNRMRWIVDCSVPLVGGTMARFIAQDIQRKSEQDGLVAQRLLAARG
ncbi:MAG: DUF2505 domain-containing protein [Nevskia sp.]|uniref:DUF2505 domain-containing protein n=1 Tax=Nevskia sp. TaxID=1929292 RepID=UPI004036BF30